MAGPLLVGGVRRQVVGLEVQVRAVHEHEPPRVLGIPPDSIDVDPEIRVEFLLALETPEEIVARIFARPGTMVRVDEREGEGTPGIQPEPELVHEFQHLRAGRIREDGIGDDIIKCLVHARQREPGSAFGVEEEASAIVGDPVRLGEGRDGASMASLAYVDAPVAFGIDVRVGVAEHVADVAAEVQHVLPTPVRLAELHGEVSELILFLR